MKLTWINLSTSSIFYKEKQLREGGLMERYLREVIGNQLTLNSPPPLIPEFIIYLLIKPMFGVFTQAIKFDCLVLGIF